MVSNQIQLDYFQQFNVVKWKLICDWCTIALSMVPLKLNSRQTDKCTNTIESLYLPKELCSVQRFTQLSLAGEDEFEGFSWVTLSGVTRVTPKWLKLFWCHPPPGKLCTLMLIKRLTFARESSGPGSTLYPSRWTSPLLSASIHHSDAHWHLRVVIECDIIMWHVTLTEDASGNT